MRFEIQRDQLLQALQKIQSSIEKRNTIPVLGSLLLSIPEPKENEGPKNWKLNVFATDLEVGMRVSIAVQAQEGGAIAVPAKTLIDIARELPAHSMLSFAVSSNQWVELTSGEYRFRILGLPAHAYHLGSIPNFEEKHYIQTHPRHLAEMIDRTLFAVSTDTAFYHLSGAYFEFIEGCNARLTATNMYCLSSVDQELFLNAPGVHNVRGGVIIPRKGLLELRKLLEGTDGSQEQGIGIAFERGFLYAHSGDSYLFVRLIDGEYVEYRRIIPQDLNRVATLAREDFAAVIKRISLLSSERSRSIKFNISENSVKVSSINPDLGEASTQFKMEYSGPEMEIGFNYKYLLEGLSSFTSDKIELLFKDRLSAVVLREPGRKNQCCVIMPMRV